MASPKNPNVRIPSLERKYRSLSRKDQIDSKTWLTSKLKFLKTLTPAGIVSFAAQGVLKSRLEVGKMYFFAYDPKYKEEMEFYDMFPLVIPIGRHSDSTRKNPLGLNLHYLPVRMRFLLLERLMDFANNTKMDETTRIKATYELLDGVSRYKLFEPCLHEYRYDHARSPFVQVDPSEWHFSLALDVAEFRYGTGKKKGQKAWNRRVWGTTGKPMKKNRRK